MINIMLECKLQPLLKVAAVSILLFATVEAKSQTIINSKFKPISYDEMIRAVERADKAYKKAEEDLEEAYLKALNELDDANYRMALFYFEKCSRINNRFEYNICDQKKLNSYISYVQQQIENQKEAKVSIRLKNDIAISLKQYKDINSDEIIKLPPYATIFILEKSDNEIFIKIRYKEYIGYISKGWLNYK